MDTNVPIVANGRPDPAGGRPPTIACRLAAVTALEAVLARRCVLLDLAGAIQAEYRRHLNPRGQPGIGDRFYLEILRSAPRSVQRVVLLLDAAGDYVGFPRDEALASFDPSDRKFAALARQEGVPVLVATDADWASARLDLQRNEIAAEFVCGCDPAAWFAPGPAPRRRKRL